MAWILRLSWILLWVLVAAAAGYFLRRDPGVVYLRFQGWEIETTLVFLGIVAAVLTLLAWALYVMVVRWPRRFSWHRRSKATARLDQGLVQSFEGRLAAAQKTLLAASTEPLQRLGALLCAAEVARARAEPALWRDILDAAGKLPHGKDIAELLRLSWDAETGDAAALQHLRERAAAGDAAPIVLRTVIEKLTEQGQARDAIELLARLAELRQHGKDLAALERRVLIAALAETGSASELESVWQRIARADRRDPAVLDALARAESRLGHAGLASQAIEKVLGKQWSEEMARVYGRTPLPSQPGQLKRSESWLAAHPECPGLLLALARLCRREGIYGKAHDYARLAARLAPSVEAYTELAEYHQGQQDASRSLAAWRAAARLGQSQSVDPADEALLLR